MSSMCSTTSSAFEVGATVRVVQGYEPRTGEVGVVSEVLDTPTIEGFEYRVDFPNQPRVYFRGRELRLKGRAPLTPIVDRDPGDENDRDLDMPRDERVFDSMDDLLNAAMSRPSTAPHAGLEQRVVLLEDIAERQADLIGQLEAALDQRSDRIARSLTHLALAVSELRSRRTLGQRFGAWWREHVYRGPRAR